MMYWLAVVDEGSFTRAAAKLHVSQPSLSQQVKALEAEVGGELLQRLPGNVRLTPTGEALLPYARAAVAAAQEGVHAARTALHLPNRDLEIATVRSIASGLLPPVVNAWRRRLPNAVAKLHEFAHRSLVEQAVRDGSADVGVGPPPQNWNGPVCRLGWEEFVVVVDSAEPLSERDSVSLTALAERDWVMFHPGHGLYEVTVAACAAAAGFEPRQAALTSQVETATRLASAGVGPALVPRNALPDDLKGRAMAVDPPLGREVSIFARSAWSPLAEAFVAVMREHDWDQAPEHATLVR
jgi:DNA-binding transcriptional LysR family regulator